ncbi:MAG: GIY-YIG nuclease family protein [Bacteroidetes bacterium]|nr:GIY-YIG nuclease family protein [Bacteroidota bacterium]
MEHPKFCAYVLYSLKDDQFYIGYTSNFERRMQVHTDGKTKSTAPRRPFIPIHCEYYFAKSDALRREEYFKTTAGKRTLRLMLKDSLNEVKPKKAQP